MKLLISEFTEKNFQDVTNPYALQISSAIVDEIKEVNIPADVNKNELVTKIYNTIVPLLTKEKIVELIKLMYDIDKDEDPADYLYEAEDAISDFSAKEAGKWLKEQGYHKSPPKSATQPPAAASTKKDLPTVVDDVFLIGDIVVISDFQQAADLPKDVFYVVTNVRNQDLIHIVGVYSQLITPTSNPDPDKIFISRYVLPSRIKTYPATPDDYEDFIDYIKSMPTKTKAMEDALDSLLVGLNCADEEEIDNLIKNAAFVIPISDKCPIEVMNTHTGFVGIITQAVVTRSDNKMEVTGVFVDDAADLNLMKSVTKKQLVDLAYFYYHRPVVAELKKYKEYLKKSIQMRYNADDAEDALEVVELLIEEAK